MTSKHPLPRRAESVTWGSAITSIRYLPDDVFVIAARQYQRQYWDIDLTGAIRGHRDAEPVNSDVWVFYDRLLTAYVRIRGRGVVA